ncbi:unnamed protein product [Alternaria alternata]|uniref:Uncharacterized protein n=1 Tax=Alternaria tenuissima TaxID=119927 RepID=A0AB37W6Y2_9PLEO|nr:hypothetical protein AA0115_g9463 [Alternaria tenuissima]RYN55372.1 hypothetical protein AA0118_g8768 [Alternaria tenuissima]
MTWRTLSYAAVPDMLPAASLDANGLIPRSFCPQVYDGVMKHVTDMQEEAQFAAWYWVTDEQSQEDVERGSIGWHPCFTLPANRRIVTRNVSLRVVANPEPLRDGRRSVSSPITSTNYSHSYK